MDKNIKENDQQALYFSSHINNNEMQLAKKQNLLKEMMKKPVSLALPCHHGSKSS